MAEEPRGPPLPVARPSLRLLHTSDVHLADEVNKLAARQALTAVVDMARAEQVDILLVVGDLFDHARAKAEEIEHALRELGRAELPVVILPGNHDALHDESIYFRIGVKRLPPNVRLLTDVAGESVHMPRLGLTLWGRPTVDHTPWFHPLADVPPRANGDWNVGLAHGLVLPHRAMSDPSSPITRAEVAASGLDYLALGHVHVHRDESEGGVPAFYSGSPVRFGPWNTRSGGVNLVEFAPDAGVVVQWVPLPLFEDTP
ncbi:MAG: DNA repair exonuclease [Chloroflexi bacterium]|nr:DNA repair exonuclease [Chloroflexota bacterium]